MRWAIAAGLCWVALGAGGTPPPASQPATPLAFAPPRHLGDLDDPTVNESSGLAWGWRNGVLWTHNDSGGEPELHAVDLDGHVRGAWRLTGATAQDWEDLASFQVNGRSYLLVGDVGDNPRRRPHVSLYLVEEPALLRGTSQPVRAHVPVIWRLDVRYPDGAQNCESVAVDVAGQSILLLSKQGNNKAGPCTLYRVPLPATAPGKAMAKLTADAEKLATRDLPLTSAMDLSADGQYLVVLTYDRAHAFTRTGGETWAEAFARPPQVLALPRRAQGESICFGADGRTLYLTSEKTPTPLWVVPAAAPEGVSSSQPGR